VLEQEVFGLERLEASATGVLGRCVTALYMLPVEDISVGNSLAADKRHILYAMELFPSRAMTSPRSSKPLRVLLKEGTSEAVLDLAQSFLPVRELSSTIAGLLFVVQKFLSQPVSSRLSVCSSRKIDVVMGDLIKELG